MAHRNAERVAQALAAVAPESTIRELDDSTRKAAGAAAALGCPLGAIANGLIFMTGSTPVLIMTSGAHRVNSHLVSAAIGVPALRRATPDEVRAATGRPIGGVGPVGHPSPIRTLWTRARGPRDHLGRRRDAPRGVLNDLPRPAGHHRRPTGHGVEFLIEEKTDARDPVAGQRLPPPSSRIVVPVQ